MSHHPNKGPTNNHQQLVPAKNVAQTPSLEIFEILRFFRLHLQRLPRVALQQDGREGVALDLRHGILDAASEHR